MVDNPRIALEAVVLAGGRGERFWPLSRRARPKQLLRLFGHRSLLQLTWDRLRARLAPDSIWLSTGADLEAAMRAELPELIAERTLSEPVARSTAAPAVIAAAFGMRGGRDPLQLVVPADHWIPDGDSFWKDVDRAAQVANASEAPLVTFGIPITRPETGYGYIERGKPRAEADGAFTVRHFKEKPDLKTARRYQSSGRYYWNSGIFLWRASALMREAAKTMPKLWSIGGELIASPDPRAALADAYTRAPSDSIDYGILEHAEHVAVVAASFPWNDIGSWVSWAELADTDDAGNAIHGDVVSSDSRDCVFYSSEGLIAALGVKDLVIVRSGDVTLVADRTRCQEVREILRELREKKGGEKFL